MARLSTMPTIPDDELQNLMATRWPPDESDPDPKSDYRCKSGRIPENDLDDGGPVGGPPVLAVPPPTSRELFLDELIRVPAVLSEHTTLGEAVERFVGGMEGPVVLVTDENRPLGILTPTHVLRMVKERVLRMVTEGSIEELEHTTMLDVATPCGSLLEENASLREAAERFVAKDCDELVVVKRDGTLAGVLLARDLCLLWA